MSKAVRFVCDPAKPVSFVRCTPPDRAQACHWFLVSPGVAPSLKCPECAAPTPLGTYTIEPNGALKQAVTCASKDCGAQFYARLLGWNPKLR